jgi:hypothetical protein
MTNPEILSKILSHLESRKDARVIIGTRLRATAFAPKHAGMFRLTESGKLQVQRGRSWDTIATPEFGLMVNISFA